MRPRTGRTQVSPLVTTRLPLPRMSMSSSLMPNSSWVSRKAVCSRDLSSVSSMPPGKLTWKGKISV